MYGFDFNYDGNHDEVVAEALGVGSGLEGLFEVPRARVVNYEPSVTFALNESMSTAMPAGDRDPDQCDSGSDPRLRRRPDQRLLHGAAILGERSGADLPGVVPPSARSR